MEIKVYLEIGKKFRKIMKIEKWWKNKKKWFVRLRDELTVKNNDKTQGNMKLFSGDWV